MDDAAEPRERGLSRHAAFAVASGIPAANMANAAAAIAERLPLLSPAQDEAPLREAGFVDIEMFYAAFTFRGGVMRNAR